MDSQLQHPKPVGLLVRIKARIMALRYFLNGTYTLKTTLWLMLPGSRIPAKNVSLRLFGKPFVLPEGDTLADFIGNTSALISSNQYHVEWAHGVIIDAGANMGIFSVFAAVKHPDAKIYAFEPAPKTFEALKENTKYYPNIKVFNSGLGEREGKMPFIIGEHSGENYIGADGNISVDIKTIDGLLLPVNFIKMDTEGYEANILRGARETIRRWKPIVVMSAYHKPEDKTELPRILNAITPYDCELRCDCEEDLVCKPR
jgi:FkbM family methyltransferase